MVKIEITVDEYIDRLAAEYLGESLGTVPKDNEALFTRMRIKRQIKPEAVIETDGDTGEMKIKVELGDPGFNEKDSLLEKLYIKEWEKAYTKAVMREIMLRIAGE